MYKVVNKNAKLVTFNEFPFQRKIRLAPERITQILKYRQGGVTTGCVMDLFDDVIFKKNTTGMILAHKKNDLPKIFDKVRIAWREMPRKLQPQVDKGGGSKYEMRFPSINSKIYIDIENRGDTLHRLHVSEAAFVEPKRLKATLGAVVPTGRVTYESTPNGMGNEFYGHWANPRSKRGKLFFPWFIQPEYQGDPSYITHLTEEEEDFIAKAQELYGVKIHWGQIAWRREQIAEYGDDFWQEYPEDDKTCFLASGGCPVDQRIVSELLARLKDPVRTDGKLEIYKEYVKDHRYVISADVGGGVGGDFSVADVFDCKTQEQVAQYRSNKIKPIPFAKKLLEIAELYHAGGRPWPLIAPELNNHGHAVVGHLRDTAHYSNVYAYREDEYGWLTNNVTRPKMLDVFIDALESRIVRFNSPYTLNECLTLVDNGGKIEATEGEHDDTVMSGAIGVQMLIHEGSNDLYENLDTKILL